MRSELNYAGKNLSEFGMWFDNSKVYKKPAKRFMGYDIPARNGTLYQSENKFNNVVIEFDCFIKDNFDQNYHDLVNYLNSFDTYQKLVNSYNGNMYRMALFHEAIEVDTGQFLKDGRFKLFFDCKPQEYYADGSQFERIAPHSDIYTGNPAKVVNEGESSVISLRVALNPQQNLNGYDSPWVGGAGKNKLPNVAQERTVFNGITYTVGSDGSIKATGTATGLSYLVFTNTSASINDYSTAIIASGTQIIPSNGTSRNMQARYTDGTYGALANGSTITLSKAIGLVFIQYAQGDTANETYYPMIRLTGTTATYEPYENICPIYASNGKNLLQITATSQTVNGVTFTVNADGTVKANGTASSAAEFVIKSDVSGNTYAGMILSGCPNGGGGSTYRLFEQVQGSPWTYLASDGGSGVTIPTTTYATVRFVIRIESGVSVNNLVFKPMIRPASITDATYQPYQSIMVTRTVDGESTDYTINLNGTRYGGTVDLATGVLTVTHASITLNSANMNNSETYPGWSNAGIRAIIGTGLDRQIDVQLNIGQRIGVNTMSNYDIVYLPVYVYGMNQTQWKAKAMDVQIVAEYATPQTVQLTAQQISLLTGINYISSSDEVTVTTRTPLILKNPSPMTAKPVFKFTDISAPFTVSANGETIISFQNAIRLVKAGVVNNMFFNATGTNLNIQKQGTPNYEETSFLINSGWLPAGRYFLATMAIGNLEVTSMDGTHLYSSGGTFTLTDMTQVKVWYVITPDASTPQNFNYPIYLRPRGTLYVDSELMDCYMLDGDTAYSFNECVSLPKDFLQLDERTVMTMTSGAVGFIAPNWWRL